jgi:SAM-dependent methyltransferase
MDRRDVVLKFITKTHRGIEIGPYFAPLTPKRDGYNCLVMDVFDSATLRKLATEDPGFSAEQRARIEDVDLVGSSTHIDDVVSERGTLGEFDYIVSSHNFEHLPNPIRFLQGCAKVLKPGGMISMAIPDRRACYDYFRPVTRLSEWIEASFEDRNRPTLAQSFDNTWVRSTYDHHGVPFGSFFRGVSPATVTAAMSIEHDLQQWIERRNSGDCEYHDSHCSVFTPSSFELLVRDCAYLGLVPFEVVEITEGPGVEFFAHLRVNTSRNVVHPSDYEEIRDRLLHRIVEEAAETSLQAYENRTQPGEASKHQEETAVDSPPYNGQVESLRLELLSGNEKILQELGAIQASNYNERDSHRRELAAANEKIAQLNDTVAALRSSTSWRITAPFRRAVIALRGRSMP